MTARDRQRAEALAFGVIVAMLADDHRRINTITLPAHVPGIGGREVRVVRHPDAGSVTLTLIEETTP